MTDPQNIVLDLLRAISGDMAELKAALADLKNGQIRIRDDIESMRHDALHHERRIASLQFDLHRVKTRLELNDA